MSSDPSICSGNVLHEDTGFAPGLAGELLDGDLPQRYRAGKFRTRAMAKGKCGRGSGALREPLLPGSSEREQRLAEAEPTGPTF